MHSSIKIEKNTVYGFKIAYTHYFNNQYQVNHAAILDNTEKKFFVLIKLQMLISNTTIFKKYTVDSKHAMYRAETAKVVDISLIDIKNECIAPVKCISAFSQSPAYEYTITKNNTRLPLIFNTGMNVTNGGYDKIDVNCDIKDGIRFYLDQDTPLSKYIINIKDGFHKIFYYNGMLQEQWAYKNKKKHGTYITYYSNGKISEKGTYTEGHKQGECFIFHLNGIIKSEGHYENNKKHGIFKTYYDNGVIQSYQIYLHGIQQIATYYNKKGEQQDTFILNPFDPQEHYISMAHSLKTLKCLDIK